MTAPGLFLLTLALLAVILLVGLSTLSTVSFDSQTTNYGGIVLVIAAFLGIAFFASRRRGR